MITQTFHGVTPERWVDIKQILWSEARIAISKDEGSGKDSHNIEFAWLLAADGTLTVTLTHVPWLIVKMGHSEESIMAQFAAWIEGVS